MAFPDLDTAGYDRTDSVDSQDARFDAASLQHAGDVVRYDSDIRQVRRDVRQGEQITKLSEDGGAIGGYVVGRCLGRGCLGHSSASPQIWVSSF